MKFFAIVFAVVVCANALPADLEEYQQKVQQNVNECIAEIKVTQEVADNMHNGVFSDADDQKTKCFVNCFFQKVGFVDKDGVPNADAILTKLAGKPDVKEITNEELKTLINKCVQEKGADPCDRSYNVYKCYHTDLKNIKH